MSNTRVTLAARELYAALRELDVDEEDIEMIDSRVRYLVDDVDEIGDNMTDVEADADTLASAGYGTDEDYGCYNSGDE